MAAKTTPENYTKPKVAGRATLAAEGKALTAQIIKAMPHGTELADPEHPGLRVRAVAEQRVFFYRYKNRAGALRQVEIGVLGALKLTEIRAQWQTLKDHVRSGGDPRADIKADKAQAASELKADKRVAKEQALTVAKVVERYLAEKVDKTRKAKGAAEAGRLLNQLIRLATWTAEQRKKEPTGRRRQKLPSEVVDVASMPAKDFTREAAHNLLLAFGQSAPRSGGMARQELRGAWRYGIAAGFLPGPSPFEKVIGAKADDFGGGGLVAHSTRDRNLSKAEVGVLLRWMAEPSTYSRTVRDALELVLRTGLRSGEVCGIHSRELTRRDGVLWLDIPADRMKAGKAHSVPLVGQAEQVAMARMPDKPGMLFPSSRGDKPIQQKVLGVEVYACSGRSKAEAYKHRRVCPVADWAPHDLRRTARTLLAELGCPYEVGEAILAHTLPGVAGVYNRASHDLAKVEWLRRLGDHLDQAAAAQATLKVAA